MSAPEPPLSTEELSHLPLFRGESPDALEWLLDACAVQALPPDLVLLSPDRHSDVLYLILSGRVRVQLDAQGKKILAYLDAGHCVGEMSIIEGVPPSAIVATDTECQLLVIEGDVLRSLIERSHAVARNLLYTLSSRLRNDNLIIIESLQQQHIYEQHSKVDVLTGLQNRRWLDEALGSVSQRSRMSGQPLSLLMLDVDHFKRYNDTHGHLAGDRALTTIATTLRNQLRPGDTAARYGGEEFIVIMPDTERHDARMIAERLRQAIQAQSITHKDGSPLPPVTVSIGVATSEPDQTVEQLLAAVDAALYRAKDTGRNRVAD